MPHRYHLNGRWGDGHDDPPIKVMHQVLSELDAEDDEHPDVSLTHESGWCLSAFSSGLLVWEHLGKREPRHMRGVSRQQVMSLWQSLSRGEIAAVEAQQWMPGYG